MGLYPKTVALVSRSGKVVVTGAKSEDAARLAARKCARLIQKCDFPVRFTYFKIYLGQHVHATPCPSNPSSLCSRCALFLPSVYHIATPPHTAHRHVAMWVQPMSSRAEYRWLLRCGIPDPPEWSGLQAQSLLKRKSPTLSQFSILPRS